MEWIEVISNLGFPIACVCVLFVMMERERQSHKEEAKAFTETINNNTLALTRIEELLRGVYKIQSSNEYARLAGSEKYIGKYTYRQMDCQGFVERVLWDLTGTRHNWRGSNHMWREAIDQETKGELVPANLIPGMLLFKIRNDGGEVARGYHDNEGNAYHVGIYLGGNHVAHSPGNNQNQGPTISETLKGWTHYGKLKMLDYSNGNGAENNISKIVSMVESIEKTLTEVKQCLTKL